MTKSAYELTLVQPGEVAPTRGEKGEISANDPKMAVLMNWWTQNIKGKIRLYVNFCIYKNILEIKKLLLTLYIIDDMSTDQIPIETDCLINNLRTDQCRAGCANCSLNELFNILKTNHGQIGIIEGKKFGVIMRNEKQVTNTIHRCL